MAVQVDPIKSTLKAPGIKRLKLIDDDPLSKFAFEFNLRRYIVDPSKQASVFLRYLDSNYVNACNSQNMERSRLRRSLLGRGLHSFPFPLNLSSLCPLPLNLSLLYPPYDPNYPVDVSRRCSS
jgi:hypothetical protein